MAWNLCITHTLATIRTSNMHGAMAWFTFECKQSIRSCVTWPVLAFNIQHIINIMRANIDLWMWCVLLHNFIVMIFWVNYNYTLLLSFEYFHLFTKILGLKGQKMIFRKYNLAFKLYPTWKQNGKKL